MKAIIAAITLAAALPVFAADFSVQISQPGVYGRVDIGRYPQPQVIVQRPVLIGRPVVVARPEPVYLWVPPGHRQAWSRNCYRYDACGVPVYFVQDRWYREHVYAGRGHGDRDEHGHGYWHGNGGRD